MSAKLARMSPLFSPRISAVVLRAQAGDREAFRRLVERYASAVDAVALAILRDAGESLDVAQEAFAEAWSHLPRLRAPESFGPWLLQLTRRRALESLRAGSRRRARDGRWLSLQDQSADDAETQARSAEESRQLSDALDELPDDARELLLLFYREGQSSRQVAELLELSDAAVRKRLERARSALRDELEKFTALALATAPPLGFAAGVLRALPAQEAPPAAKPFPRDAAIAAAVAVACLGFLVWRHTGPRAASAPAGDARADAAANEAAADPSPARARLPDASAVSAAAEGEAQPGLDAPNGASTPAAAPAESAAAQEAAEAAPPRFTPIVSGAPAFALTIDLPHVEERLRELAAAQERDRTAPPVAHWDLLLHGLLPAREPRERALLGRWSLAVEGVMRAHGALLVFDAKHALASSFDATAELLEALAAPRLLTEIPAPAQPAPLAFSEMNLERIVWTQHHSAPRDGEVEALREQVARMIMLPQPGIATDLPIAPWSQGSLVGTEELKRALAAHEARFSPPLGSLARAAVFDLAALITWPPRSNPSTVSESLYGASSLPLTWLKRDSLDAIFDMRFVLDHDARAADLTGAWVAELEKRNGQPLPLISSTPARLSFSDVSDAEVYRGVVALMGAPLDAAPCSGRFHHLFLSLGPAPVRELVSAVETQLGVAFVNAGGRLEVRCEGRPDASRRATRLDFSTAAITSVRRDSAGCVALTLEVAPLGPWARRGIEDGDVLEQLGGRPLCADLSWLDALAKSEPGQLTLRRAGNPITR